MHASFSLKILLEQTSCILMHCGVAPLLSCAMSSPQNVETSRHHKESTIGHSDQGWKALQTGSGRFPCCHPLAKIALSSPRQASTLDRWVTENWNSKQHIDSLGWVHGMMFWDLISKWMIPFAWMCVTADSTWSPKELHSTRKITDFPVASHDFPACCMTCATQTSGMRFRDSLASPIHKLILNEEKNSQMSTKKDRWCLKNTTWNYKSEVIAIAVFLLNFHCFFRRFQTAYVGICHTWTKLGTRSPHRCAYEALHENNDPWPGHPAWDPVVVLSRKNWGFHHHLGMRFFVLDHHTSSCISYRHIDTRYQIYISTCMHIMDCKSSPLLLSPEWHAVAMTHPNSRCY